MTGGPTTVYVRVCYGAPPTCSFVPLEKPQPGMEAYCASCGHHAGMHRNQPIEPQEPPP